MTTYYVGDGGSDSAAGTTWATRWATIGKANSTLTAGDEVQICGGRYSSDNIAPSNSGVDGSPIVYTNYNDELVVIEEEDDGGGYYYCANISKNYVTIRNVTLEIVTGAAQHHWIKASGATHCTIDSVTFRTAAAGTSGWGVSFSSSSYAILRNCIFAGVHGVYGVESGDFIRIIGSDYCLIEDNDFWDAQAGHGYILSESDHTIIRRNIFRNLWQKGAEIREYDSGDDSDYTVFEENIIFDSRIDSVNSKGGKGVQFAGSYLIIRRNVVIFNALQGISLETFTGYTNCRYNRIYGNIFYGNGDYGLRSAEFNAGSIGDTQVVNNILTGNNNDGGQLFLNHQDDGLDGFVIRGNCIFGATIGDDTIAVDGLKTDSVADWETSHAAGFYDNVDDNPDFTDPDGFDFTFQTGDPCRGGGVPLTLANGSGSNSTALTVDDAGYFHAGHGITTGDVIKIGSSEPVRISGINYSTNVITLNEARTWSDNDEIHLAEDSLGNSILTDGAPDIGRSWKWEGR